jgi:L-2-hydroxyglutarate oxidase LhgO
VERVDALVIGAGVVGLAVGRALALSGRETIVVEAESRIGCGVSSRSSEVVHAGLYYPAGSLKSRLCRDGRAQLARFCARHGVPSAQCGKLVVATGAEQHAALHDLERQAQAVGVPVQALTGAQAQRLEPALECTAALASPTTGIIDSHSLMLALQGEMEARGGLLALRSRVLAADFGAGRPGVVRVATAEGESELEAAIVVNAAGLQACALAHQFRGLAPQHVPRAFRAKGSYFTLVGESPFSRLIYPLPVDAWLGVHLTFDLAGRARFGPDLEWLAADDPLPTDYRVDPARGPDFEAAIRRYWPGLPSGALQPAYSGVRPRIHGSGEPAADFRIDGPARHGVAGLVNLFGIESPGLSSALAIGDEVLRLLGPS